MMVEVTFNLLIIAFAGIEILINFLFKSFLTSYLLVILHYIA